MKIAAYIRVSTKDQNTEMQLDDIKKYCEFKGWSNPAFFIDHGESGAKTSRPEFDKMMKAVRSKEVDVLLTWKFDRIGRSSIHLIQVMQELKELNVDFISIKESIDTTTAMGKMIFTIFAALAEFERDTIKMRTKTGQDLARSKGIHCGRPETYSTKDRQAVIAYFNEGVKPDKIGEIMGMDRSTVYRIIKKVIV